jgi:hypothetical protein
MATVPYASGTDRDEARFFFTMACLTVGTIVAGFSLNIVTGRSSFASPPLFHFHGVVMLGGLGLYLAQTALVAADNVALHRKLGWIAVGWVPLMVVTAVLMTRHSLQMRGGAPFFDQNQFLISNPLYMLVFAGFVARAIVVRKNTGWHRRLMFWAFATLTGPGVGRLVPVSLFIPYGWYFAALLPPILFAAVGMLADKRRYGRVHPAWLWSTGLLLAVQLAADLFAYSPAGIRFTEWVLEGTPGAERSMEAVSAPM